MEDEVVCAWKSRARTVLLEASHQAGGEVKENTTDQVAVLPCATRRPEGRRLLSQALPGTSPLSFQPSSSPLCTKVATGHAGTCPAPDMLGSSGKDSAGEVPEDLLSVHIGTSEPFQPNFISL